MEEKLLKKQWRVMLINNRITVDHPSDRLNIYEAKLKLPFEMGWIETKENALNYYEICGIFKVFGLEPPSYEELLKDKIHDKLKIN